MLKYILMTILLTGCVTKTEYIKKPPFKIPEKNLQLREYKNLNVMLIDDNVCYSSDDYLKTLYLLNDLKNYIQYQKTLVTEINEYYQK